MNDETAKPPSPPPKLLAAIGVSVMALTALAECLMGRKLWGVGGKAGFWSSGINSEHNSQWLVDPYSFTHVLHGILFYGLLRLAIPKRAVPVRMLLALILESAWEILENSDFIINRYRAQTISLHYYGDSIVNSMSDIVMATLGFALVWRLPVPVVVGLAILFEVGMALAVRDNLTLNVIMLIRPVQAIRAWQEYKF